MPQARLRSIVPMFGGATSYVDTLTAIIDCVDEQHSTTDELIGWHRGSFARVSSQGSIMRRIGYLEDVGFFETSNDRWTLGPEGEQYVADRSTETLLEIMCRRNVGLRSSATIKRDVALGVDGFDYAIPVTLNGDTAMPLGHVDSSLQLYNETFDPSVLSSSTRATRADGIVVTRADLTAGETVAVRLHETVC